MVHFAADSLPYRVNVERCSSMATLQGLNHRLGSSQNQSFGVAPHPKWAVFSGWMVAIALSTPLLATSPAGAQQIIDGLPPAPLPSSQPYSPPSSAPSVTVPPLNAQPTAPVGAQTARSYIVVVDGDSPLLLSQVQQVDAAASVVSLEGRSLIQAGIFQNEADAAQRVQQLATRGIGSRVVAAVPIAQAAPESLPTTQAAASPNAVEGFPIPDLPSTSVPRELEFEPTAPLNETDNDRTFEDEETSNRAYYIVIPGNNDDLYNISQQVVRMAHGIRLSRLVEERDSPLGSHVLVGPFTGRRAAHRWNRYFSDFGMNSRVYFQR